MSQSDTEGLMGVGEQIARRGREMALHGRISGKSDIIVKNRPGSESVG